MAARSKPPYARGFAVDAQTERALRAGLPGRDARVQRGPLSAALRSLATQPPSRLVFVDLDGVSEPEDAANRLTEICAFETTLVAIGSTDTAEFSRALLQRGIADYLVKPISAAEVREASSAVADDPLEHPYAGRVVTFLGSPGSGTSTLVAAVAHGIAAEGRASAVVDLDPVSGKIPAALGVGPQGGLSELLHSLAADESAETETSIDPERLEALCTPVATGVSLIGYPPAGPLPGQPSVPALCTLFQHLANRAHIVLVTGVSDPGIQFELMQWADSRVLVYEPTLSSIGGAVHRLAWLGGDHPATLVQCLPRRRRYALSSAQIRYALAERRPDVIVPFDPALRTGALAGAMDGLGKACRESLLRLTELVGRNAGS